MTCRPRKCNMQSGRDCSWKAIQSCGELRPMRRTHIHFATLPSHMRKNKWAQVFLKLKLQVSVLRVSAHLVRGKYCFHCLAPCGS